MNYKLLQATIAVYLLLSPIAAQETDPLSEIRKLMEIKVISSAKKEQRTGDAAASIIVITHEMIERRGYRNLVEIMEDVPGFDFATYEDGGGEYPTHSINRGIGGDPGNTKIVIMVDNIVQNHISFNWSQGWTNEQILHDVERIEVIQGPGSALYGANALSGVINIITKKKYRGTYTKIWGGKYNTRALDILHGGGTELFNYQVALHGYKTDGDGGKDRPDPEHYFHYNQKSVPLTAEYDGLGNYRTDLNHPLAGFPVQDGFNTSKDDKSARVHLSGKNNEIGFFYWDKRDGLGSYVTGYEYNTADPEFIVHHDGYHVFGKNTFPIVDKKINLISTIWHRAYQQKPDTGFEYNYKYFGRRKTYHSDSSESGIEEQLNMKFSKNLELTLGTRYLATKKMEQIVSLGQEQKTHYSYTSSSWDIADNGGGLYQKKQYDTYTVDEIAFYGLAEGRISDKVFYSLGGRYDEGDDYGKTVNPRAGIIVKPVQPWNIKLLYGTAFRQPTLFELHDEFRGNRELKPEKVRTYELVNDYTHTRKGEKYFKTTRAQLNLFHSEIIDTIAITEDITKAGGESYNNISRSLVRGASVQLNQDVTRSFSVYINYIYTEGKIESDKKWHEIDHMARDKANLGFNWLTWQKRLNINMRLNHVAKRKLPETNSSEKEHAPAYTKVNMALTLKKLFGLDGLEAQLVVKNMFNTGYYGVGRQAGSSDKTGYNPATNPNPPGFIPPYHPQPRRTYYFNLSYRF